MGMRLLPRREIDKAKASDRQREVDEGVKLAEKVDTLREIRSKEEVGLEKWRVETLKGIQEQISSLSKERNALEDKVKAKRDELFSLSAPLDRAWKFYVTSERAEIERVLVKVKQELSVLQNRILENDSVSEDLKAEGNRLRLDQQEIIGTRAETKRNLDESLKVVEDARLKARTITRNAERILKDSEGRQLSAKEREANVKLKEESLKRKEDELETREMAALAKELLYYSPIKKN